MIRILVINLAITLMHCMPAYAWLHTHEIESSVTPKTLATLQKQCDALTKADKEGHKWEAVGGKLVDEDVHWAPSESPPEMTKTYGYEMNLKDDKTTKRVFFWLPTEDMIDNSEKYKKFTKHTKIIGTHYSVCAYSKRMGKFNDEIEETILYKGNLSTLTYHKGAK